MRGKDVSRKTVVSLSCDYIEATNNLMERFYILIIQSNVLVCKIQRKNLNGTIQVKWQIRSISISNFFLPDKYVHGFNLLENLILLNIDKT